MYGLVPDLTSYSNLSNVFKNDDKFYHALPPFTINPLVSNCEKIIKNISSKNLREPWLYYVHSHEFHWPLELPDEYDK